MAGLTVKSANGKAESEEQSNSKDFKKAQHVTGQPVGSNRRALDTLAIGVYLVSADNAVGANSTDNIVHLVSHGAKIGDVCRIQSSANSVNEFEVHVDEIIDADHFKLSCILSADLEAGDLVSLLRPVAQRFTADGGALTTIEAAPITFVNNGTTVQVVNDDAVPGNNTPLPVEVSSASGPINITAGDLNVQLSDLGVNADVTRIGGGDGYHLEINATREALVHDTDALAQLVLSVAELVKITTNTSDIESLLSTLNGTDFATQTTLEAARVLLASIAAEDFATETTLAALLSELQAKADQGETQPVSLASVPLATGAATEAKQDAIVTAIGNIAAGGDATAANQVTGNASLDSIDTNIGDVADAAVTNPASSASAIAALKGLMTLITSTNTKLDTIDTNTSELVPTFQEKTNLTTTAQTFTAPAGAKWCKVMNVGTENIRLKMGGTATISSGIRLDSGRSEDFSVVGDISVIAEAGTNQEVCVIFGA